MKPSQFICAALMFTAVSFAHAAAADNAPAPRGERAVVIVWDGLRPDSINAESTPNLHRFAQGGVFFARHHSAYPSSTEVNGTAMATGCHPGRSGMIGNLMYLPAINALEPVATEAPATIRRGDEVSGGKYLAAPTLAETIQRAGGRTAIAGTKFVVLLHDRAPRGEEAASSVVFAGSSLPPGVAGAIERANGMPFPAAIGVPNVDADAWTTDALIKTLWKDGPPKLSVLWLSDPDFTQHRFGPDSPQAHQALASADANLGKTLAALEAAHCRETTDVFVVSDHGFSTVTHPFNLVTELGTAGFDASVKFKEAPKAGQVLVALLGGSAYLYVGGHDGATVQRLVDFFQRAPFAGVIFTREAMPGTFALGAVKIDGDRAPDVAVAFRWTHDKNASGFPGQIYAVGRKEGQGTHASLSPYDMHNTLVARGPDFRAGFRDEMPSANIDLAPTIAHILKLPNVPPMDGRVLTEALVNGAASSPPPITSRATAERPLEGGTGWRQYLQTTQYGGVTYLDEGNVIDAPVK